MDEEVVGAMDDREHRLAELEKQMTELLRRSEELGRRLDAILKVLRPRDEKYGTSTGG